MAEQLYRVEHDLIGDEQVPADAYYGIQTQRAMRNFDITGVPISHFPELIKGLAMVKKAAALANRELGQLDRKKMHAIVSACDEIIDGKWHDQFPVDLIQGGAGTSTNMNANEVIANRGLEIMGKKKGACKMLFLLSPGCPSRNIRMITHVARAFLIVPRLDFHRRISVLASQQRRQQVSINERCLSHQRETCHRI